MRKEDTFARAIGAHEDNWFRLAVHERELVVDIANRPDVFQKNAFEVHTLENIEPKVM